METLARGSTYGFRSSSRSSGTSRTEATKSPSCSRTSLRRPCSLAASSSALAYMRWATATSAHPPSTCEMRGRGVPISVAALLERGEVEAADGVVDQAAVGLGVECAGRDLLRGDEC